MSKVNENLAKYRNFRGIKQADLAAALCKSRNTVSNWESAGNAPDLDTIEKICKILDITPNQLFGWEPNPEYEKIKELAEKRQRLLTELEEVEKQIEEVKK